ncbi:hypothetical protein D3C76_1087460 [compost metagenome]
MQHAGVAGTQAHGAFAPVWRITDPDRVAATAVLVDAELLQHFEKRHSDVAGGVARFRRFQSSGDAFDHGFFAVEEMLWRFAQVDRARQRAVITLVATGNLEKRPGPLFERRIVPGQVRRAGIGTGRQ